MLDLDNKLMDFKQAMRKLTKPSDDIGFRKLTRIFNDNEQGFKVSGKSHRGLEIKIPITTFQHNTIYAYFQTWNDCNAWEFELIEIK